MAAGTKRGSKPQQQRVSGDTAAEEEAHDAAEAIGDPVEPTIDTERAMKFRTPGFHRMRMSWNSEERQVMDSITEVIESRILANFGDAYQIMEILYEVVRTPVTDPDGNPLRDTFGFVVYKRTAGGGWEEDYSKLTRRQREDFLFMITTRIFAWEQKAANAWTEAMFAKVMYEERHAIAYDAPLHGTIDDRNAAAMNDAKDEKYFALFQSAYSRKADSIVRSMQLLSQRLRDSLIT